MLYRGLAKSAELAYVYDMTMFLPKLEILPDEQRQVWTELSEVPPEFTLYGGTAVALHLGHRQSVDFDFFGSKSFAPLDLAASLAFLKGGSVLQSEPNTLTMTIGRAEPVKFSFFGVPRLGKIKPPHVAADNGLRIASLIDLLGTKLAVVQQRAEPKDYIDIDAIVEDGQVNLSLGLSAAQAIYGAVFSPQNALKALVYFEDQQLQTLDLQVKQRLVEAVRAVNLDQLPKIKVGSQP